MTCRIVLFLRFDLCYFPFLYEFSILFFTWLLDFWGFLIYRFSYFLYTWFLSLWHFIEIAYLGVVATRGSRWRCWSAGTWLWKLKCFHRTAIISVSLSMIPHFDHSNFLAARAKYACVSLNEYVAVVVRFWCRQMCGLPFEQQQKVVPCNDLGKEYRHTYSRIVRFAQAICIKVLISTI
jgi:hypothetical protein